MHAYTETGPGFVVLKLPASAQLGPKLKDLLALAEFQKCGTEWQNHYRKDCPKEELDQYLKAAKTMANLFNSGKREYCKELLTKTRIKHG
jgi:hypothetical protein